MALVSCPECGKEVSTHAEACPNCGCPKDVILKSIKKRTETKEYTKEETEALRKKYSDKLDDLDKKISDLLEETKRQDEMFKKLKGNKENSWTWMDSGSLWWF